MFRGSAWNRFLLLLPGLAAWVGAASTPATKNLVVKPEEFSIALPGGSLYVPRGIYSSISGGQYHNYGYQNALYQWQGEMGFFYKSWFSGGVGFKMLAGQPFDSTSIVRNRFFLLGRFHKSWSQFSGYFGTQIGMEDLNLSRRPTDTLILLQPLERINAGLGFELGMGWKFSRYVGATFEQRFEASLVGGGDSNSIAGSVNFRSMPGLAIDVLAVAPPLRKNVKALYVFVETQMGQLTLENHTKKNDFAWITGVTVAF